MSSRPPGVAVALLYETRELSEHLRDTLATLGAAIVYEAPTHALDRDALEQSCANVVVVNLDAHDDPDLDDVYGLLDDARYRVVFNDGEVSSALSGWDHARWVRHLAAKIVGDANIDPPRPLDAQAVPVRMVNAVEDHASHSVHDSTTADVRVPSVAFAEASPTVPADSQLPASPPAFDPIDFESLIEMPAVLPASTVHDLAPTAPGAFDVFDFDGLDDLLSAADAIALYAPGEPVPDEFAMSSAEPAVVDSGDDSVDHIAGSGLAVAPDLDFEVGDDLDFEFDTSTTANVLTAPAAAIADDEHAALEWSLEDVLDEPSALPQLSAGSANARNFGIETLRAEEFLAPVANAEPRHPLGSLSGLSLELMPLEEAVAPTAIESAPHENWLDPDAVRVPKAKVRRVWVLGASIGGPEAVREFLAGLPRDYPALFLVAQHLGEEFIEMMARQLAQATALTVRMPGHGERAGHGEVLIVPPGQRLLVDAQGVVVLERDAGTTPFSPSIDRVVRDLADRFGADAGAIIFSGMSTDAAAGCRHLVEKGGLVYAQRPDTCVVSTMIDGVNETGLVSFFGSPRELAEKLIADSA